MKTEGFPLKTDSSENRQEHCRYGLPVLQLLRESWENLRLLGRRTALALLGIAIGCAAVVALLSIGHNAQQEAMSLFRAMGTDLLIAHLQPSRQNPNYDAVPRSIDTHSLLEAIPEIRHATALIVGSTSVRWHSKITSSLIINSSAELNQVLNLKAAQGRLLNEFDKPSTYAVLGAQLASELTQAGPTVRIGSTLQLGSYLFEIVGILRMQGWNPLLPISVDDSILLSDNGILRLVHPPAPISAVIAQSHTDENMAQTATQLQDWLSQQAPGLNITVQTPQLLLDNKAQQSRLFAWLLIGLSAISLLVGGIGVMNVMVMSVNERTQEIGVRMALGARTKDIARLFLLEATLLSIAGALLGALLGLGAAWLFVYFSQWAAFSLSLRAVPLGMSCAIATGLFFGLYPALSAAKLEPVQALRHA